MGKAHTIADQIAAINRELHQVSIRQKGDRLYLRGTFPPKPGDGVENKRYEVATKKPATAAGLKQARAIALEVESLLIRDRFDWSEWLGTDKTAQCIGDWVEQFERDHWARVARTLSTEATYRKGYALYFDKLPQDAPISLEVLRMAIESRSSPGTRARLSYCQAYGALAKFAGLNDAPLREMGRGYSSKTVNPRTLPTDDEIKGAIALLPDSWHWVYGAMVVYGLRNHEVMIALPDRLGEDVPLLEVPEDSKTGARVAFPIAPLEWDFDVRARELPPTRCEGNIALGMKMTRRFKQSGIPFTPYALRHAFARRGFEMGFPPDFLAMSMGHSLQTHLKTYRAWWGEQPYMKVYREVMERHKGD